MDVYWIDLARLLAAIAAGAIVGLERELQDKPAGFRTNIMICLGAALFTLISVRLAEGAGLADRTRIAAQVVTGVGFLGAGAIIQARGQILGLTTAATIWTIASLGMAFGAGFFAIGAMGTVLAGTVLFGLGFVEARMEESRAGATFEIEFSPDADAETLLEQVRRDLDARQTTLTVIRKGDTVNARLTVRGQSSLLDALQRALAREPAVRSLKRV